MIGRCTTAIGSSLLLAATMWAQDAQAPKVRILFSEGHLERASMTYGLYQPSGGYSRHFGVTMPSDASFFEIPAATDRFKALVWAPGCKMKEFDVPVENSDIELEFACDPLKNIPFRGRVKSIDISGSVTISANYMAFGTCVWMDACSTGTCRIHCGGPQIIGISTADVSADGTFNMELPDFSADPIVSGDSSAELEFRLNEAKEILLLRPESSQGTTLSVATSYPTEVTFEPVEWRGFPAKSH
jgi:hypothetical protein